MKFVISLYLTVSEGMGHFFPVFLVLRWLRGMCGKFPCLFGLGSPFFSRAERHVGCSPLRSTRDIYIYIFDSSTFLGVLFPVNNYYTNTCEYYFFYAHCDTCVYSFLSLCNCFFPAFSVLPSYRIRPVFWWVVCTYDE